mmetsp:Transcript_21168/g.64466  ORF Transcript_21168/g.64466 Transcript_21168/m.64466 type:complete len:92 (-) Transcript_21168:42-317(-)
MADETKGVAAADEKMDVAVVEGGPHAGAKHDGPPRFVIKKWNAVAMWSWDICADTCAICRNSLNEPSIEYQVRPERAGSGLMMGRGVGGFF